MSFGVDMGVYLESYFLQVRSAMAEKAGVFTGEEVMGASAHSQQLDSRGSFRNSPPIHPSILGIILTHVAVSDDTERGIRYGGRPACEGWRAAGAIPCEDRGGAGGVRAGRARELMFLSTTRPFSAAGAEQLLLANENTHWIDPSLDHD